MSMGSGKAKRVAIYLRVSTDGQTTENQRQALEVVAERRGWRIVQTFEDAAISGAKGRDKRPGLDGMMRAAGRGSFDLVMVWAVDRLGRSTATVAPVMAELGAMGVGFYADKEGMDATTAHGRAMLQMASVFAELERAMIVERVKAGLARAKVNPRKGAKAIGRPKVGDDKEAVIRDHLAVGTGIVKVAGIVGVGVGTVQRVKRAMAEAA
jgi:DNA invertase Pin-like site-specific DNA recombinase